MNKEKLIEYLNSRIEYYSGGEEMKSLNETISDYKIIGELKKIIKNVNEQT